MGLFTHASLMGRISLFLPWAVFGFFHATALGETKPEISLVDFYLDTRNHVARVERLGVELFDRFHEEIEKFPHDPSAPDGPPLTREMIRDFLSLHDQSKVNLTYEFLTRTGVVHPHGMPIERLYRHYGKDKSKITKADRAALGATIDEINAIDREIAVDFFHRNGLISPSGRFTRTARILLHLEKVADAGDRYLFAKTGKEFGKSMTPGSRYLTDAFEIQLSRLIEETPGLYEKAAGELLSGARTVGESLECLNLMLALKKHGN